MLPPCVYILIEMIYDISASGFWDLESEWRQNFRLSPGRPRNYDFSLKSCGLSNTLPRKSKEVKESK